MHLQELVESTCPYCGEPIQLLVDCSVPFQEYIEDCQVCCKPMQIRASVDADGNPDLLVQAEND
ncbi:MAG: CPXCG motif-containing cysteine-rich protein [Gammaproteobacteria bacterium]|nr:CPXCG motif-containing cysteine-rich protein [Gammaproteobacteria bacterium]MDD9895171.1 CPXCG motif-containing cysteine-rich protein [Gammaproteobacteria bacterium]MDD9960162.1 CPXCG motif-containing cysteine-rich protein [Gammaproteobacteria bacterium]